MAKPVNMNVAAAQHQVGSGPGVKEAGRPSLGSVKDFTTAKLAKATEVMRDVALSIACKIDRIWDRINPAHNGSAVSVVGSIFHDPTISMPVRSENMMIDIRATREEVMALHSCRFLALSSRREGDVHKAEEHMKRHDEVLNQMAPGRRIEFCEQLDKMAGMLREQFLKGSPNAHSAVDKMDFQMLALDRIWGGLNQEYRLIDKIVSDVRDSSKPYIDDPLTIDDDFWNWSDPSQSIAKEKALVSGFQFLRQNITEEGMWRVSGGALSKKQNLERIDRGIAPTFNDVNQATDVLKVLIGTTNDDYIAPYLNHSLSSDQFDALSKKAEEKTLTIAEMDAVLKAAFGNNQKKLEMFKALLVLLKETSEHNEVNKMTVENLVTCPLNGLLQRNFQPDGEQAKNFNLGAFLINNADAILS